jgi:hypothetical protein
VSTLDYVVESEVECLDDDTNDIAFIRATATIGGRDAVKEFMACKMYPLASGFIFRGVTIGSTLVSKVRNPLLVFPVEALSVESASRILAEVETRLKGSLGALGQKSMMHLKQRNSQTVAA